MGRMYTATLVGTALTLGTNAFELVSIAGQIIIIHSAFIGQSSDAGDAAAEMVKCRIQRASGSYTVSNGGAVTPAPHQFSDPAFGGTVRAGSTNLAVVGTGVMTTMLEETANVQAGWYYSPTPEERMVLSQSQAFILSMIPTTEAFADATPDAFADSLTISARVTFEVLGAA